MATPKIKIENARGQVLDLSADPRYLPMITAGAEPPTATINRNKIAVADGTRYNSATVNERNLVLTVYFKRDIAAARQNLYRYAAAKSRVKVYYTADDLDLFIEGYVEAIECDPWEQNQFAQISIICPQPYWLELSETFTNASNVDALFEFPFSIDAAGVELSRLDVSTEAEIVNNGQVASGAKFEIVARITTQNPVIHNLDNGEYMGFDIILQAGDRLIIDTVQGQKSITLVRGGVSTNVIDTLVAGSTWLQLDVGVNTYSYTMLAGNFDLYVYHTNKYMGV